MNYRNLGKALLIGSVAILFFVLLFPLIGLVHEKAHILTAQAVGVEIITTSIYEVTIPEGVSPSFSNIIGMAGGLTQAIFAGILLLMIDFANKRFIASKKGLLAVFLIILGIELSLAVYLIEGLVTGLFEGFFHSIYLEMVMNYIAVTVYVLLWATLAVVLIYKRRISPLNDIWIFGYGSLIWYKSGLKPVEEKVGCLKGWHRDWTWISKTRHGAPTCSLEAGGEVKGIFYKLNPKTQKTDLEIIRKRERKETEEIFNNTDNILGEIHFWKMGSNIGAHPDVAGKEEGDLYRALAQRSVSISEKGPDGKTAVEYALLVNTFDPEDEITHSYSNSIRELIDSPKEQDDEIEIINTRIESLSSNRTFFTILLGIESAILTIIFGNIGSLPYEIGISICLLAGSLVFILLAIFVVTDSIHFYSKYLEYNYAWNNLVQGLIYKDKRKEQRATQNLANALESDDIGYRYLKLSLFVFMWFLSSTIFIVPPGLLALEWKIPVFLITGALLSITVVWAYKGTHRKSTKKAIRDFFKRNPVF